MQDSSSTSISAGACTFHIDSTLYNPCSAAFKEHLMPESDLSSSKWENLPKKNVLQKEFKDLVVRQGGKEKCLGFLKDRVTILLHLALLTSDERYLKVAIFINELAKTGVKGKKEFCDKQVLAIESCLPFNEVWRQQALKYIDALEEKDTLSSFSFIIQEKINLACRKGRTEKEKEKPSGQNLEDYDSFIDVRIALVSINIFSVFKCYCLVESLNSLKDKYRFVDLGSYKHDAKEYAQLVDKAKIALSQGSDSDSHYSVLYKRLTRLIDAAIITCTAEPYLSLATMIAKQFQEKWGFEEKLQEVSALFREGKFNQNWKTEALFFVKKLGEGTQIQGMSQIRTKIKAAIDAETLPGFHQGQPPEFVRNSLLVTSLDSVYSRYKLVARLNDITKAKAHMISLPENFTHSTDPTGFMTNREKKKRVRSKSEIKNRKNEVRQGRGRGVSLGGMHFQITTHKVKHSDDSEIFQYIQENVKELGRVKDSLPEEFEEYLECHKARSAFPEWEVVIQKEFKKKLEHVSLTELVQNCFANMKNLLFLAILQGDVRWLEISCSYIEALKRFNPPSSLQKAMPYLKLIKHSEEQSVGGEDSYEEILQEVKKIFMCGIDRTWKINCMEYSKNIHTFIVDGQSTSLFKKKLEQALLSHEAEWKDLRQLGTLKNIRILLDSSNLHLALSKYQLVKTLDKLKKCDAAIFEPGSPRSGSVWLSPRAFFSDEEESEETIIINTEPISARMDSLEEIEDLPGYFKNLLEESEEVLAAVCRAIKSEYEFTLSPEEVLNCLSDEKGIERKIILSSMVEMLRQLYKKQSYIFFESSIQADKHEAEEFLENLANNEELQGQAAIFLGRQHGHFISGKEILTCLESKTILENHLLSSSKMVEILREFFQSRKEGK